MNVLSDGRDKYLADEPTVVASFEKYSKHIQRFLNLTFGKPLGFREMDNLLYGIPVTFHSHCTQRSKIFEIYKSPRPFFKVNAGTSRQNKPKVRIARTLHGELHECCPQYLTALETIIATYLPSIVIKKFGVLVARKYDIYRRVCDKLDTFQSRIARFCGKFPGCTRY